MIKLNKKTNKQLFNYLLKLEKRIEELKAKRGLIEIALCVRDYSSADFSSYIKRSHE